MSHKERISKRVSVCISGIKSLAVAEMNNAESQLDVNLKNKEKSCNGSSMVNSFCSPGHHTLVRMLFGVFWVFLAMPTL